MLTETELQTRAVQMVDREVNCCLSALVATLAGGYHAVDASSRRDASTVALRDLTSQAYELAAPIDDYEEAATQAGWEMTSGAGWRKLVSMTSALSAQGGSVEYAYALGAQAACEADDLEPYQWEVYEHWAVSQRLADKLAAKGEKIDNDFAGLCVWGRTTTGQAISMDDVIRAIVTETMEAV